MYSIQLNARDLSRRLASVVKSTNDVEGARVVLTVYADRLLLSSEAPDGSSVAEYELKLPEQPQDSTPLFGSWIVPADALRDSLRSNERISTGAVSLTWDREHPDHLAVEHLDVERFSRVRQVPAERTHTRRAPSLPGKGSSVLSDANRWDFLAQIASPAGVVRVYPEQAIAYAVSPEGHTVSVGLSQGSFNQGKAIAKHDPDAPHVDISGDVATSIARTIGSEHSERCDYLQILFKEQAAAGMKLSDTERAKFYDKALPAVEFFAAEDAVVEKRDGDVLRPDQLKMFAPGTELPERIFYKGLEYRPSDLERKMANGSRAKKRPKRAIKGQLDLALAVEWDGSHDSALTSSEQAYVQDVFASRLRALPNGTDPNYSSIKLPRPDLIISIGDLRLAAPSRPATEREVELMQALDKVKWRANGVEISASVLQQQVEWAMQGERDYSVLEPDAEAFLAVYTDEERCLVHSFRPAPFDAPTEDGYQCAEFADGIYNKAVMPTFAPAAPLQVALSTPVSIPSASRALIISDSDDTFACRLYGMRMRLARPERASMLAREEEFVHMGSHTRQNLASTLSYGLVQDRDSEIADLFAEESGRFNPNSFSHVELEDHNEMVLDLDSESVDSLYKRDLKRFNTFSRDQLARVQGAAPGEFGVTEELLLRSRDPEVSEEERLECYQRAATGVLLLANKLATQAHITSRWTLPLSECRAIAYYSILKAAQKWSPEGGARFSTFYTLVARNELIDAMGQDGLQLSYSSASPASQIARSRHQYTQQHGRSPSPEELVSFMDLAPHPDKGPKKKRDERLKAYQKAVSDVSMWLTVLDSVRAADIDSARLPDGPRLSEATPSEPSTPERRAPETREELIARMMNRLPSKHSDVLNSYWGLGGRFQLSDDEYGAYVGMGYQTTQWRRQAAEAELRSSVTRFQQ